MRVLNSQGAVCIWPFHGKEMDPQILFIVVVCLTQTLAAPRNTKTLKQHELTGDCDFDEGWCRWMNIKADEFDWIRRQGRTPSSRTGPRRDHTSGRGHYLFIESSQPRKKGDEAKLVSRLMKGVYCMNFFYHMYGASIGELKVIVNDGTENRMAFDRVGEQGNRWFGVNATVYGTEFRIIISATVGRSYDGDIAIDDLHFLSGSCDGSVIDLKKLAAKRKAESIGKCTFDHSLCGWTQQLLLDNFDWTLALSSRKTYTGPKRDNTGNLAARYLYMDSANRRTGDKARILSRWICGEHCLRFSYHMFGSAMGELIFYTKQQGDTLDRIWARSGNQGSNWHDTLLDIHATGCYKIMVEGVVGGRRGDIALDDLWLKNGTCCPLWSTSYKNQEIGNCDFNRDFCKWSNIRGDNFDWQLGSGKSKSSQTGPSGDASGIKDGKYAYVDASEPRVRGDKAVLMSSQMRGALCLHFKYHMYGEDVGSLAVYQNNDGLEKLLLWKQQGNFGNIWHQGFINTTCNSITEAYEIEFVATIGGWRGDIAIDNIYFTSNKCPPAPTPPKVINGKHILPPSFGGYCGFVKTFCGWTNAANNDYFWRMHKGATPSAETGPNRDADNNDRYAYLEASNAKPGAVAELVSGWAYGTRCLSFKYHMHGKGAGELRVKLVGVKGNGTQLWAKKGSQSPHWQTTVVTLTGQEYKIVFVGVRGSDYRGDIALDGIRIRDGECFSSILGFSPFKGGYPKLEGCNFDRGMCGWKNQNKGKRGKNRNNKNGDIKEIDYELKDDFDWVRRSGGTPSGGTGPSADHTTRRYKGKYMYIESSSPRRKGDKAKLVTTGSGEDKCMTFYFHMYGKDIARLTIYQDSPGVPLLEEPVKLWEKKGNQGNRWIKANVLIPGRKGYRIIIEGVVGKSYVSDIAIDDIDFTDGSCE